MATIPRLTRPTVRPTPEPSRQRPLEAYGTDTRGVAAVGAGLLDVAGAIDRERTRISEIRVNEAEVTFSARLNALMRDPKDGILQQQGTNAVEALDPFRDRLRMTMGEVEASLATPEQRLLFRRAAERHAVAADAQAMGHIGAEQRRVDAATHEALLASDLRTVSTEAGNDVLVQGAIRTMRERVLLYADRNGIPPEVARGNAIEAVSAARVAQVEALATAEDFERASAVASAHQADLTPDGKDRVKALVQDATLRGRSRQEADRIISIHPEDERAALAEARKIENTLLSDETVRRIEARFADDRRLKAEAETALLGDVLARLPDAKGDLSFVSAADKDRLKRAGRWDDLLRYGKQLQNGTAPETEWDAYQELFLDMDNATLAKVDPNEYRAKLSNGDFKMLVDRIAMLRQTGGRGDRGLTPGQMTIELLDSARGMGLLPEGVRTLTELKKHKAVNARFTGLMDTFRAEVETRKKANAGIPLSGQEQREAMQDVLADEVITATLFGGGKVIPRGFAGDLKVRELTPEERVERERTPPTSGETKEQYWNRLRRLGVSADSATAMADRMVVP